MDPDLLEQAAHIAHELWRRRQLAQGWQPGTHWDATRRVHDALVPFDQLTDADKFQARLGVKCLDLDRLLESAIEYQRGPSREFTPAEMRAGREVELTGPHGQGPARARGAIEGWELDAGGRLSLISVRFPDGDLVAYSPSERELRRPEEVGEIPPEL